MTLWLHVSGLILAALSLTQSAPTQINAAGEHRIEKGETEELAKQFALADATFKAWEQVVTALQGLPEIKALSLKQNQAAAFVAATVQVREQLSSRAATPGVYRTDVRAELDPAIAGRFGRLRKDQETAYAVEAIWQDLQRLHQQLSSEKTNQQERALTLTRIRVKILAAQVSAALAKTENSLGSARVASPEGRERAKQLAQTALELGPDIPDAHAAMGDVLSDAEDAEEAEAEYRKALSLDPKSAQGHVKLANALRLGGNLNEAIAELREALRLNADSAPAHTDLGIILAAQGNAAEAMAQYREALRLDPDFVDAHNGLAIALARQRQMPDAALEFRQIVRIDPDSALGYYNLATALADLDQDQESAAALREVLRINPNHFNAHFNAGELFRLEGKLDEAVTQFREYVRLAPDTPQNQRNIERAKDFIQTHENK